MSIVYPRRYLAVDLETTGLSSQYDYITQIGAVVMEAGAVIDMPFTVNVRPNPERFKVTPAAIQAQAVNLEEPGYGAKLEAWLSGLLQAPTPREAAAKLAEWLDGQGAWRLPVLAHNAAFDMAFLGEFQFQQRSAMKQRRIGAVTICTMNLAREVWPGEGSYSLDACMLAAGLPPRPSNHDALQDAILAGRLYWHLVEGEME